MRSRSGYVVEERFVPHLLPAATTGAAPVPDATLLLPVRLYWCARVHRLHVMYHITGSCVT
jgi:hypothetical protein